MWGRTDQYGQPWLQSFNTGGASQVFVERDGSGTPLGLHTGGSDFYLVLDNLGSVVAVVNTTGSVVARYSYDPYGNTVSVDESGLSQPNIVRFAGGAFDQTSGLTKLGQRYYDPALGAFTQQDANQLLANPQNGNLYAYVGDSPASYIDPTGADFVSYWTGPLVVGGAVGAIVTVGGVLGGAVTTGLLGLSVCGPVCGAAGFVAGAIIAAGPSVVAGAVAGAFAAVGDAIANFF